MALSEKVKERFGLRSRYLVDLVLAEEQYLIGMGWVCVETCGHQSVFKHPRSDLKYTRNHAVLIAKADDHNLGLW